MFSFSVKAFPKIKDSNCSVGYYDFCVGAGKNYPNMCPKDLESIKEMCLISDSAKISILKNCKDEILSHCGKSKKGSFNETYFCVTNPIKWDFFSKSCLDSLSNFDFQK